jgi:hypothetical protein
MRLYVYLFMGLIRASKYASSRVTWSDDGLGLFIIVEQGQVANTRLNEYTNTQKIGVVLTHAGYG